MKLAARLAEVFSLLLRLKIASCGSMITEPRVQDRVKKEGIFAQSGEIGDSQG